MSYVDQNGMYPTAGASNVIYGKPKKSKKKQPKASPRITVKDSIEKHYEIQANQTDMLMRFVLTKEGAMAITTGLVAGVVPYVLMLGGTKNNVLGGIGGILNAYSEIQSQKQHGENPFETIESYKKIEISFVAGYAEGTLINGGYYQIGFGTIAIDLLESMCKNYVDDKTILVREDLIKAFNAGIVACATLGIGNKLKKIYPSLANKYPIFKNLFAYKELDDISEFLFDYLKSNAPDRREALFMIGQLLGKNVLIEAFSNKVVDWLCGKEKNRHNKCLR